jgi:catechol 2,3-dioxygenase-like lactoylglutathione lyase family enzyme
MATTMKIEVVFVPVSDDDRAIEFYRDKVGFVLDHDHKVSDDLRFIQLTPVGSACSIVFGRGMSTREPGSLDNVMMVVEDVRALRAELVGRGVSVSDIDEQPWGHFAQITDPDGNRFTLQQLPVRG